MVKKTCAAPGCARQPSFNLPGSNGPMYCKQHAAPDMVRSRAVCTAGLHTSSVLHASCALPCGHANRRLSVGDSVPVLRGAPEQVSVRKRAASASAAKNQQHSAS